MNEANYNIMLTGVGGQGLMILSKILGNACNLEDKPVITGEQHGLSQRSGTINVHFRIGKKAFSPLIPIGMADLILATEAMEALRYIEYLKDDGFIVMNSRIIHPPIETNTLISNKEKNIDYIALDNIVSKLKEATKHIIVVDALTLANKTGTPRTENIVLLGTSSSLPGFPLNQVSLKQSIERIVPPKTTDANLRAFEMGFAEIKNIKTKRK